MRPLNPLYDLTIYLTEDNRHAPFVVKGLIDLESDGLLKLNFKSMPMTLKNRYVLSNGKFYLQNKGYPWCIEMDVKNYANNNKCRIGIDLQDWSNFFSFTSFKRCDIIYKRALTEKSLISINENKKDFVKPFGPNCKTIVNDTRYNRIIRNSYNKQLIAKGLLKPKEILKKIMELKRNNSSNVIIITKNKSLIEPPPKKYIFFQVEYHDLKSKEANRINLFRARLIRNLKKTFKEQFYGGMWFKNSTDPNFEDCLTNVNTNYISYSSFIKNASIVISTNGFGDSIPWKIVEYMRLGCCIVSENNKHLFRHPIDDNTISYFNTYSECVKLCERLLDDKNLMNKMRINSSRYYKDFLAPKEVMKNVIAESLVIY